MRNQLITTLVIAAFLAVILSNPSTSFAGGTDPTLAAHGVDLAKLDGRLEVIEKRLAKARRQTCAETADAVCKKAFDDESERLEGLVETARTKCQQGDAHVCTEKYNRAMTQIRNANTSLDQRVTRLENDPKAFITAGVEVDAQVRSPMSDYNVSGKSPALGVMVGTGLETHDLGVMLNGHWQSMLGSGLHGNRFAAEMLVYKRQTFAKNWSLGAGLSLATTRLIDSESTLRYSSAGPGVSLMAMRRSGEISKITDGDLWKYSYVDLHTQLWIKGTLAREDTFAYGDSFGHLTTLTFEVGFAPVFGGRAGRVSNRGPQPAAQSRNHGQQGQRNSAQAQRAKKRKKSSRATARR